MKTIILLFTVWALCVTGRASTNSMLCGIRVVETQDLLHPPRGKLGERGPYQFRRNTWRMHTSSSFDLAENREVANIVAKRHYAWIEAQLKEHNIEPTPYCVALAWNAGVNAVIRGEVPSVSREYAERVLNIAGTIADDTPPKQWQAPTLVVEESPAKPEKLVTPVVASAPVLVPQGKYLLVSTDSPIQRNDLIEVRYETDPIMLAFSRNRAL